MRLTQQSANVGENRRPAAGSHPRSGCDAALSRGGRLPPGGAAVTGIALQNTFNRTIMSISLFALALELTRANRVSRRLVNESVDVDIGTFNQETRARSLLSSFQRCPRLVSCVRSLTITAWDALGWAIDSDATAQHSSLNVISLQVQW